MERVTSDEARGIATDLEFVQRMGIGTHKMRLRKFPAKLKASWVWEARFLGGRRYYYRKFNEITAMVEINNPGNKTADQEQFAKQMRQNPQRYEAFFNKFRMR